MDKGYVYLIGAGPGDPDLLTLKASKALKSADVIVYDYLSNNKLLEDCKPDAEYIYVGKQAANHAMKQEDINQLLAEKGKAGHTVARLKGGDPYVFGRGGEEAIELRKQGVRFETIPGITSAIAGPSYAGIPVTHRGVARSFHVMTGHFKDDYAEWDWEALTRLDGTLIFLMGIGNIPRITQALIESGKAADTPAAVIRWATYPIQKTVVGTLETLADDVEKAGIKPPGLIVVGPVVDYRDVMSTFENRPLFGQKIIVTRSRAQAGRLSGLIETMGAEVVELPMIEIEKQPVAKWVNYIETLKSYTWIVFTSQNAVEAFMDGLYSTGVDARQLGHLKLASIGSGTAKALKAYGLMSDVVPKRAISEALAELMKENLTSGDKVLVPSGNLASDVLKTELSTICTVDMPVVYDTVIGKESADHLKEVLAGDVHGITFTSASTVRNFNAMIEKAGITWPASKCFSIGPKTSKVLNELGVEPVESDDATIDSLVTCIEKALPEMRG